MKGLAILLSAVLVVSLPARAEPAAADAVGNVATSRGFLSTLGISLLGLGLAGAGLGVAGLVMNSSASATLATYGTPARSEASTVADLDARARQGATLEVVGFIAAGVCVAAGIALLVVDTPRVRVGLSFLPTKSGGLFGAQFVF